MLIGDLIGLAETVSIGTALAVIGFLWRYSSQRKQILIARVKWEQGVEHRLEVLESSTATTSDSVKDIRDCLMEIKVRLARIEEKLQQH